MQLTVYLKFLEGNSPTSWLLRESVFGQPIWWNSGKMDVLWSSQWLQWSLPDLFLNLTIDIVLFTFVQERSGFRWGNAELLTCKYLENLAYSSLGKMEGYISKIEKHYCMATHLIRWGCALQTFSRLSQRKDVAVEWLHWTHVVFSSSQISSTLVG